MSRTQFKWPAEPITRELERRGGGVESIGIAQGLSPERANKYADAYYTALREHDGLLTLRTMDGICCDVLGMHPMQLYGLAYFDPGYDTARVHRPCRRCKGPKEAGQTHLCTSCYTEQWACACGCGGRRPADAKGRPRQRYIDGHKPHNLGRPVKV